MGNNALTIKRRDGISQTMNLADWTLIKTSAGRVSPSDLQLGEAVTIVINDGKTASVVLACGTSGSV